MKHHLLIVITIIAAILTIENWQWQFGSRKDSPRIIPKIKPTIIPFPEIDECFDCPRGLMSLSHYQYGRDEAPPAIAGLPEEFLVIADTNLKATNFYSAEEDESWELSKTLDTFYIKGEHYGESYRDDWDKLTGKQKEQRVLLKRKLFKEKAEYLHSTNNNGKMQVWIINNTKDSVLFSVWDNEFMCIMEALSEHGQWRPIQYRVFFGCHVGTMCFPRDKWFLPKTANSFVVEIPNEGDYRTKLRFKFRCFGDKYYYYSNEFVGKINYCSFVMDSNTKNTRLNMIGRYSTFKEALLYTPHAASYRNN